MHTADDIDSVYHFSVEGVMLNSSINPNGIPPDLEFTLDEISTELAKLGVKETSQTRLAAIKADLDKMIARDLDNLSIGEGENLKSRTNILPSSLTSAASCSVSRNEIIEIIMDRR